MYKQEKKKSSLPLQSIMSMLLGGKDVIPLSELTADNCPLLVLIKKDEIPIGHGHR